MPTIIVCFDDDGLQVVRLIALVAADCVISFLDFPPFLLEGICDHIRRWQFLRRVIIVVRQALEVGTAIVSDVYLLLLLHTERILSCHVLILGRYGLVLHDRWRAEVDCSAARPAIGRLGSFQSRCVRSVWIKVFTLEL